MDEDMAYLTGLISAKGTLIEDIDTRRLVIDFPYRNLDSKAPEGSGISYIIPDKIKSSLVDSGANIAELLGVSVDIVPGENNVQYIAKFPSNSLPWRNLKKIFGERTRYDEFEVNPGFWEFPTSIIKAFIRGYADSGAMPSEKDAQYWVKEHKIHRITLQFNHNNWLLPIQICSILQTRLGVPVAHILWGHPSLGRGFREHRLRIKACDFVSIGFGFSFKQDILEALCNANENAGVKPGILCNPKVKRIRKRKQRDEKEKSERLPAALRKHFNSSWKICKALGCKQGKKDPQLTLIEEVDDEDL